MPHDELALGFLILVATLPVLGSIAWYRTCPHSYFTSLIYFLSVLLTRVMWRAQVPPLPLPEDQGAVLVCNHRSSVDPFFVRMASKRHLYVMVAREFCEHPAFHWFLSRADAIPVNRGGIDTAATKAAIRHAAEGRLVCLFPEGRINAGDQFMLPCRPGAILVALKARVPVLPCYIHDAPYRDATWSPFVMTAKVSVHFGEPIDLSAYFDRETDNATVGRIMLDVLSEIAKLAGREDFEPQLAGRRWLSQDDPS
jgi:1-acyl-sn-glycerol-3-phosphate acyltransferase